MKIKIYLVLFLVLFSNYVIYGNDHITVASGSFMRVSGSGELRVTGNLTNNGTFSATGTSTVKFIGTSIQQIGGTSDLTFNNITIANSGAGVNLGSNIIVIGAFTMNNGDFDLKDFNVNLGLTDISGETSTNRIKATNGTDTDGEGSGTITVVRTINSGSNTNIGGLGIDINPSSDFGITTITRSHFKQQGTEPFTSNYSIFRDYTISPASQAVATIKFIYFPSELNGHIDGDLIIFQYVKIGAGIFYTLLPTANVAGSVEATTMLNDFTYYKMAVGSIDKPLPVQFISFTADCDEKYVQLRWATASETNNDYFVIEKSINGNNWMPVTTINGMGNNNSLVNYSYTDTNYNKNIIYYRLKQTNFNGTFAYSEIITSICNKNEIEIISIYPIPAYNYFSLVVYSSDNRDINIKIENMLGQLLYTTTKTINKGLNNISLDSKLSSSTYYLRIESNDLTYHDYKQIFIK